MENKNGTEIVNVGSQSGIKVFAVPENYLYVVQAPNSYDVYWPITGKMADKETPLGYKLRPQDIIDTQTPWISEQIKNGELQESDRNTFGLMNLVKFDEQGKASFKDEKSVHIVIELDKLSSNEEILAFNKTVLQARQFNDERTTELNRFQYKNGKEGELSDKVMNLVPQDAFEPAHTVKSSLRMGRPENNWVGGKVVEAGKFYTMVYTGTSSKQVEGEGLVKTHHVRVINTSDILDGQDWKLQNREKAIRSLCPEDAYKSFNWSPNKKIRVSEFDPERAIANRDKKLQAEQKYSAEIDPTKPKAPTPVVEKRDQDKPEQDKKAPESEKKAPEPEVSEDNKSEVKEKKKAAVKSKAKEKSPEMAR